VLGVFLSLLASTVALAGTVRGEYVESRTADVYTGPCFANGEVGLTGSDATLAWKIREGGWNGVSLEGLTVVAIARANSTLGDPYHDPFPARAVLLVDDTASDAQASALEEFARAVGGRLLENVVEVRRTPIQMVTSGGHHDSSVMLLAGDDTEIRTRAISDKDHFCGNETTYYPPLTELSHAMPAYALSHRYTGNALGAEWKVYGKRSAFVGTFEFGDSGTK
jgi:hypothetical protein